MLVFGLVEDGPRVRHGWWYTWRRHRCAFPEARACRVPAADECRLSAYKLFAAYDSNQAAELAEIRARQRRLSAVDGQRRRCRPKVWAELRHSGRAGNSGLRPREVNRCCQVPRHALGARIEHPGLQEPGINEHVQHVRQLLRGDPGQSPTTTCATSSQPMTPPAALTGCGWPPCRSVSCTPGEPTASAASLASTAALPTPASSVRPCPALSRRPPPRPTCGPCPAQRAVLQDVGATLRRIGRHSPAAPPLRPSRLRRGRPVQRPGPGRRCRRTHADAVLFADPKRSASDIIQALGRALRQPPGAGKVAVLIIPVYIGPSQSTERAMLSSEFAVLWEVLNGLRTHDSRHWRELKITVPRPRPRSAEGCPGRCRCAEQHGELTPLRVIWESFLTSVGRRGSAGGRSCRRVVTPFAGLYVSPSVDNGGPALGLRTM